MEALILNTKFEVVSVVDVFESFIWTDRYRECGDFELYLAYNYNLMQFLLPDNYIVIEESDRTMIIEQCSIDTDSETGIHLTVTGRSLESILDRRIVWGQMNLVGNFQDKIEQLMNNCIINPSDSNRKIENIVFKRSTDERITALKIDAQYTGDNLYDIIQTTCEERGVGFKMVLTEDNKFEFSLYVGEDRTYDQSKNAYVEFSPSFDNILNSNYLESKKSYKSIAFVAGEGEGSARKTISVGDSTLTGMERRELFVDARDISSNVSETNSAGESVSKTLTTTEYNALLTTRGEEKLAENVTVCSFEGEADATGMFKYGVDFNIGDTVQIVNEFGMEGSAVISELIISQDSNGISIYPTFDNVL